MKAFVALLLVATCWVACTHAYPGATRDASQSDESGEKNVDTVLIVPQGSRRTDLFGRPVLDMSDVSDIDDDSFDGFMSPGYFNPFRSNPFDGFLTSMQSVMHRLREQMAGILSGMPQYGGAGPWGKIPEGANTTSTVKIIDGHVVTINETTYTDGDDSHGTLIRVRIIDVAPQNDTILLTESETDAEATTVVPTTVNAAEATSEPDREATTPARSVETVEEFDNEISKNQVDTLNA